MKNAVSILIIGLTFFQLSCDKVEQPPIIISELDMALYPGDFLDYEAPSFEKNANTQRNVLIEDFTGHKCAFCPGLAVLAEKIETNNPGRVFVASIHASPGPGGFSENLQGVNLTGSKYTRDFTTPEGKEIAEHLSEVHGGGVGNPIGSVNRMINNNGEILYSSEWEDMTSDIMESPLLVNVQAKSNYFPETNGIFIHTEIEFLSDLNGEFAVAVYALENQIIDWQTNGLIDQEDYKHHNVHIGNVFVGESFGRVLLNDEVDSGQQVYQNFSYKIPDGLDGNSMHFQIYVYNKATQEILQVIEHRF